MTGLAIVLQTVLTDTSLPIIELVDKLLVPGSLVLIDPIHSANPWPAGVPTPASILPNIAWKRAAAMIGSGNADSLGAYFDDSHQPADALFERTSKGALHGIYSQVNNTVINRGAALRMQPSLRDYIYANRSHRFYQSVWSNRTRKAITTNGSYSRSTQIATDSTGSGYLCLFDASNIYGNAKTGVRTGAGINGLGNQIQSVDGADFAFAPVSNTDVVATIFQWGNYDIGQTAWANKSPSDIFYRGYVEDLTVSGRTYAQVDALDYALWQANFAVGGRYFGDNNTNPAALP